MENDINNSDEAILDRLTWRSGEKSQKRLCTADCYGVVHFDYFLMWRENTAPPILDNRDARALLGARLFLEGEDLGEVILRDATPVSANNVEKSIYKPIVMAFLQTHPDICIENYAAQILKVQYVRPEH